jgi:hypothetical protein
VSNALCINHQQGQLTLDTRCQGFDEGLAATAEQVAVSGENPTATREGILTALRQNPDVEGLLTLGPGVAEQAADRVKHVHRKDADPEVAGRLGARDIGLKEAVRSGAFRPLGEGDVDIGRLVELLEGARYSRWYVLEQDIVVENEPEEGEGPVNDVRKILRFLETCLGGSR